MLKFILGFCLISTTLFASFPTIEKMKEASSYIEDGHGETLVVFDLDYTVTMPSVAAFHMAPFKQYKLAVKEWIKGLSEEERFLLAPYIVMKGHSKLIEQETPSWIASLNKRGIKTIALTACPAIGNMVEWRAEELKRMGIQFSASFPNLQPFKMTSFKEQFDSYPGYYQGIIYGNASPFLKTLGLATKGEILEQFFKVSNWQPGRVILIDDDLQNLESMSTTMQKLGIPFIGLHYIGAEKVTVPHLSEEEMKQAWLTLIQEMKTTGSPSACQ